MGRTIPDVRPMIPIHTPVIIDKKRGKVIARTYEEFPRYDVLMDDEDRLICNVGEDRLERDDAEI
ncbi:MAG: hypothetical protein ACR2PW_04630 [Gammaproteobacteria bacterium]